MFAVTYSPEKWDFSRASTYLQLYAALKLLLCTRLFDNVELLQEATENIHMLFYHLPIPDILAMFQESVEDILGTINYAFSMFRQLNTFRVFLDCILVTDCVPSGAFIISHLP